MKEMETTKNTTEMKNTRQIFDYIQGMNPTVSTVSSMGSFVTEMSQQVSDSVVTEVVRALPEGTLAYKIATSNAARYSEKQLWVMAYELTKNEEFVAKVADFYERINRKENAKNEVSKAKLAANKEASSDILAPIKEMKKIGEFGRWLNTPGNIYRSQHFNKKYTASAVNTFLNS